MPRSQQTAGTRLEADSSYPLYDTVIPATLEFSQPMARKNRDRKKPSREVPKANLAAPMMPSLYFFMTSPPENIPRATAGMLTTPTQSKEKKKSTANIMQQRCGGVKVPLVHISHKTIRVVKDENSFSCFDAGRIPHYRHRLGRSKVLHGVPFHQLELVLASFYFRVFPVQLVK